jgi:hypothetical protein
MTTGTPDWSGKIKEKGSACDTWLRRKQGPGRQLRDQEPTQRPGDSARTSPGKIESGVRTAGRGRKTNQAGDRRPPATSKRKTEERKKPSAQRRTTGPTLYTRAEERPASTEQKITPTQRRTRMKCEGRMKSQSNALEGAVNENHISDLKKAQRKKWIAHTRSKN